MTADSMVQGPAVTGHNPFRAKRASNEATFQNIIDIRRDSEEHSILEDIKRGLRPSDGGEKTLPTLLLYDEAGLKLFEKITYLEEYYLTNAEIEVLENYAERIAERIKPGSIVVELGSGNLRKIQILLEALEKAQKNVEYFALDVSLTELERTLSAVPKGTFHYVKCFGLHGTYDDGLNWLKLPDIAARPKSILTMGSSIGNFTRSEAAKFLKGFSEVLQPGDTILVGLDACKDPEKVYHAYNDMDGITHEFILNGLLHANQLLGYEAFNIDSWKVIGEYDKVVGRHHAFVSPTRDVSIDGVIINKDERIRIEESYKYSELETAHLWEAASLVEGGRWSNKVGDYALHMAYKPYFEFSLQPTEYAATPVPSISEWENLWAAWDTVTIQMIPKEELLSKPIKLRNACIFYLGHIPTFLAIHLHRATGKGPVGLEAYQRIFERGIDPDVENPELCHDHSEIPNEWPPVEEVLAFQGRVRSQLRGIYSPEAANNDLAVQKALWISFEHEVMHLETLLYMLVQSERTQPPHGTVAPDFEAMAGEALTKAVPNEWFQIPAKKVTIGINDDDNDTTTKRYFGWDNEKPPRIVYVNGFSTKARPITNGEYAQYLEDVGVKTLPASWTKDGTSNGTNGHPNGKTNGSTNGSLNGHPDTYATNGSENSSFLKDKAVRTVFGKVPLKLALDWPVMASYDELACCALWMGGRIPTMEEVHSIYEYVEEQKSKECEQSLGITIPAVNSHLINDGVEETPPSDGLVNGFSNTVSGPSSSKLFVDLKGANVGFKHWHPIPVTPNGNMLSGQGELGGVWEWTSTVLEKHEGFEPMALYPGYTADFFDGKHNVVLGGSWATHPRVAGRKSFVNWYQRNYPYVWAGARIVRDL